MPKTPRHQKKAISARMKGIRNKDMELIMKNGSVIRFKALKGIDDLKGSKAFWIGHI